MSDLKDKNIIVTGASGGIGNAIVKKLSKTGERCLIVVNDNKKFLGTITDGDIRKSILKKDWRHGKMNFLNQIEKL